MLFIHLNYYFVFLIYFLSSIKSLYIHRHFLEILSKVLLTFHKNCCIVVLICQPGDLIEICKCFGMCTFPCLTMFFVFYKHTMPCNVMKKCTDLDHLECMGKNQTWELGLSQYNRKRSAWYFPVQPSLSISKLLICTGSNIHFGKQLDNI